MRHTSLPWKALCLAIAVLACTAAGRAADWLQFRGPNGCGVAEDGPPLPVKLVPQENAAWSTPLPPGLSSPVIAGDRVYVTALRDKALLTLALDRAGGKIVWEKPAPADRIEEVHSTSSPAASTPASDGELVVVFFGSYGLLCYDKKGNELWRLPLGPFKNPFGESSSPIISGDLVVLNCDQDLGSFLIAVEKESGKVRWKKERPEFPRGYSTPIIWDAGGPKQVVVAGTLRVKGYELSTGDEIWSADGLARIVNPTPVAGDGLLFVASFSPGGDTEERISMPAFESYAKANDADKNGLLSHGELKEEAMKQRFLQIDADKDGFITPAEWDNMARIFDIAKNGIMALKPGAKGSSPIVSALWRYEKGTPYVPSPLYYRGHLYMVKDGGIFTSIEAASGKPVKQGRLPAGGNYYSSLVAGGGQIYAISLNGEAVVIAARPDWEVLSTSPLGERCASTPAIADGKVYVRTERRLTCFAGSNPPERKAEAAR